MARRDLIERRVLGAIELTDGTSGLRIRRPLKVRADGLTLIPNRSGLLVITDIQPLDENERTLKTHLRQFDTPPDQPDIGSVSRTLSIADPLGTYLPRQAGISLPRQATLPDNADADDLPDLFTPIEIKLYRAPAAAAGPNWSGVRFSLRDSSDTDAPVPLVGALIDITLNGDDEPRASGLTDKRGEAFVPVPGLPITVFVDEDDATPADDDAAPADDDAAPADDDAAPADDDAAPGDDDNVDLADEAPVEKPSVTVALSIRSHAESPWPADPDSFGDSPITWVPSSGPMPSLELKTGEIKHLRLDLRPQP